MLRVLWRVKHLASSLLAQSESCDLFTILLDKILVLSTECPLSSSLMSILYTYIDGVGWPIERIFTSCSGAFVSFVLSVATAVIFIFRFSSLSVVVFQQFIFFLCYSLELSWAL